MRYKRIYLISFLLVLCMIAGLFLFTSCKNQDELSSEKEESSIKELVLSYLLSERADISQRIYDAADAPDLPQEEDYRIDSITYAGESTVNESVGAAYKVEYSSYYFTRDENAEKVFDWYKGPPYYIVLRRNGYENTWDGVFGCTESVDLNKNIDDVILEVVYGLHDIEVSLCLDGMPQRIGPSAPLHFFNEEGSAEKMDGWDPIYSEGDYWVRYRYDGLTAVCYHNALEDSDKVVNLDTTRTDVATHRGIRVGMTREEVLAAYPNLYNKEYWGYEGDYLWYCSNEEGWGTALLFWFEDDAVVKIELNNVFD